MREAGAAVAHAVGLAELRRRPLPQPSEGEETAARREEERVAVGVEREAVESVKAAWVPGLREPAHTNP